MILVRITRIFFFALAKPWQSPKGPRYLGYNRNDVNNTHFRVPAVQIRRGTG